MDKQDLICWLLSAVVTELGLILTALGIIMADLGKRRD